MDTYVLELAMKIEFKIDASNEDERNIIDDFMDDIIESIRTDMIRSLPSKKMDNRELALINSPWMRWRKIPRNLDMYGLCREIINNIIWRERAHTYVIEIDSHKYLKNSRNKLSQVARFLDKGNEATRGTFFISKVFSKYGRNLRRYWISYVSVKLKRITTSEIILIE